MRFGKRPGWLGLPIAVAWRVCAAAYNIAAYVHIFAFFDSSSRRHTNDVIARRATRPFLDSRKRVPHFPTSHPCIATLDPGCLASLRDSACHENPRDCLGRSCQTSQSRNRARTTQASDRHYRARAHLAATFTSVRIRVLQLYGFLVRSQIAAPQVCGMAGRL